MIYIRKLIKDDVCFLNSVRNECAEKYLHDSRTFSIQDSYKWFETTNPDYYLILYNDISIGYFRLSNHSIVNKNIYIGADLHKDWRGKITLEVLSTNLVAKNLYKKLGFIWEGTKRKEIYKNGLYIDSEIMSMLREEYEKQFNK